MSISVIFDIKENFWSISENWDELFSFGMRYKDSENFFPKNLSFGWEIYSKDALFSSRSFPEENKTYRKISKNHYFFDRVFGKPDQEFNAHLWVHNDGLEYEHKFVFVVPRPEKVYPSWIWVDGAWSPPVPYPEISEGMDFPLQELYFWNEDTQTWNWVTDDA